MPLTFDPAIRCEDLDGKPVRMCGSQDELTHGIMAKVMLSTCIAKSPAQAIDCIELARRIRDATSPIEINDAEKRLLVEVASTNQNQFTAIVLGPFFKSLQP